MLSSQRTGDSFSEKYDTYSGMIYRLGIIYLKNKADAEDITQEAFIKLFNHAPDFPDTEDERYWLIRVTVNLCKDRLKSFWRKKTVPILDMDFTDREAEDTSLLSLVLSLPKKTKDVIYLYYYEGYNISELSRILHISESAVKMRLKRGREHLKMELEGKEYEAGGFQAGYRRYRTE
jgi:RNA polymerase sigma-70 factor (ECF subfamily)